LGKKGQALITTEVTDKSKGHLAQGHHHFHTKLLIYSFKNLIQCPRKKDPLRLPFTPATVKHPSLR